MKVVELILMIEKRLKITDEQIIKSEIDNVFGIKVYTPDIFFAKWRLSIDCRSFVLKNLKNESLKIKIEYIRRIIDDYIITYKLKID